MEGMREWFVIVFGSFGSKGRLARGLAVGQFLTQVAGRRAGELGNFRVRLAVLFFFFFFCRYPLDLKAGSGSKCRPRNDLAPSARHAEGLEGSREKDWVINITSASLLLPPPPATGHQAIIVPNFAVSHHSPCRPCIQIIRITVMVSCFCARFRMSCLASVK